MDMYTHVLYIYIHINNISNNLGNTVIFLDSMYMCGTVQIPVLTELHFCFETVCFYFTLCPFVLLDICTLVHMYVDYTQA